MNGELGVRVSYVAYQYGPCLVTIELTAAAGSDGGGSGEVNI